MINIITEPEQAGWVIRKLALSLSEYLPMSKVTSRIDPSAQVNIFMPYYYYFFMLGNNPCPTPAISFFTHQELDTRAMFNECADKSNWNIAMCEKTAALLPKGKTSIVKFYPDKQFYKEKITIGLVGKYCPSGRKNYEILADLEIDGIEFKFTMGKLKYDELPDFYKSIDYLLVTSTIEGGPMPVLEALAMGKPVITPDVGFAWEHSVIKYDGTREDLTKVLKGLVIPKTGWQQAASEVMDIIQKVCL